MSDIGRAGITQLSFKRQELMDQLAASMSPTEMQLNVLRRAMSYQQALGEDFSLGAAFKMMTGDENQARTLERAFSPSALRDLQGSLQIQRREAIDRTRARLAQYRTPGLITRAGRGLRDIGFAASDAISDPFRRAGTAIQNAMEESQLAEEGGRMHRFGPGGIARTAGQQADLLEYMQSREGREAATRGGRIGSIGTLGQSTTSAVMEQLPFFNKFATPTPVVAAENLAADIEKRFSATGLLGLIARGPTGAAFTAQERYAHNVTQKDMAIEVAKMITRGESMSRKQVTTAIDSLQRGMEEGSARDIVSEISRNLNTVLSRKSHSVFVGSGAATADDFAEAARMAEAGGARGKGALKLWMAKPQEVGALVAKNLGRTASKGVQEVLANSILSSTRSTSARPGSTAEEVTAALTTDIRRSGGFTDEERTGIDRLDPREREHRFSRMSNREASAIMETLSTTRTRDIGNMAGFVLDKLSKNMKATDEQRAAASAALSNLGVNAEDYLDLELSDDTLSGLQKMALNDTAGFSGKLGAFKQDTIERQRKNYITVSKAQGLTGLSEKQKVAAVAASPEELAEIQGTSVEIAEKDKAIAELAVLRSLVGEKDVDSAKLSGQASIVFARAVDKFVGAVDNTNVNSLIPIVPS